MSEQTTTIEEPEMIETEVIEPTRFVKTAMILEAAGTVHSVLSLPDNFVMPGFLLVEITDSIVCEPGMSYSKETGEFFTTETSDEVPDTPAEEQTA